MFTKVLLASGFAALAAAQSTVLGFDHVPNPITDGQQEAITFHTNDTATPVTIVLKQGISTDLQPVETLTTSAMNGQYVWTPSKSLANGNDYALYIQQGSAENYNYFGPFEIQGANPSAAASASSSSAHSAGGYGSSHSSSSSSSKLSSTTVSANGTASTTVPLVTTTVGTVGSLSGTGTALPRNTTMSIATLTSPIAPSTTAGGSMTSMAAGTTGATSGAGFQSTTASAPASSSTNAASGLEVSGALSVLFGVAAAAFYLQ